MIYTRQEERVADNKNAFDEIVGDPFSKHDIVGQYTILRNKSSIRAVDNGSSDSSSGTGNAARPNPIDFICDVENAINDGLIKYAGKHKVTSMEALGRAFISTYITAEGEYLAQRVRAEIEQIIGRLLIARKISPVVRYFTALRQKKRKL